MSTWHEKLANRKQEQLDTQRKKQVEINDINFPTLGNMTWSSDESKAPESKTKMSSLLAEWDAKAKETEATKKAQDAVLAEERRERMYVHSRYTSLGNRHSRDEDTYYEDDYEDTDLPPVPTADTSSDWRTVERPVRKPKKSAIEKMMMEDIPEVPVEDTSVWKEEESIWDRDKY
jgi:hypothetical protein